jgi:Dehydrogenases with different specificities (related to short-chain alcohol dehydrogenases)
MPSDGTRFDRQRVLITGGSRGIGRATALLFAQRGARVAIGYQRDDAAAASTLAALPDVPSGSHTSIRADLADPAQVEHLVDAACSALGGLDVLVGNAGIGGRHRIDEDDYATWQAAWNRILAVNLVGSANLAYAAARHMIASGGGRMVFISSRGAFRGEPDQPAYGASKAGLNALAQSLAQQLAPHGIGVGVVAPGFVETDLARDRLAGPARDAIRAQSPLGRVAQPDEVARAAAFLASADATFATGAILDVNGASYLRS